LAVGGVRRAIMSRCHLFEIGRWFTDPLVRRLRERRAAAASPRDRAREVTDVKTKSLMLRDIGQRLMPRAASTRGLIAARNC
jgi:hypothetical protein